ncbi:type II toxin-antitoxin system VapC family toxin [Jiangella asiatica]|uniref:Ribonuclease VapC n=1 Tax=Jiangella asiatica TaxID=2530372 RepID=A0A4R5CRC7_9ACTN|nr:type II toxin-antitoxin system VapC family toxin [Jiangella asiatica]TDE00265.1 type II toxin-antitoxin system VapC family toxin [Jiangella asiatica]
MILVDTDVLIAHLRGVVPARDWLRHMRTNGPLLVSAVTVTELTGGMLSAERREVWGLLSALRVEPVTEVIARVAGELMRRYRRSHSGIGLGDYLVAATAGVRGVPLATLNVRHFPMFDGLAAPFELPR